MRLYYANKDDPRVFVYRDENGPFGYGVTLNFAHRKARVTFVLGLILLIVPTVALVCLFSHSPSIEPLLTIPSLLVCVCLAIISYRGAARDLKKYPGLKGPRKQLS